MSDSVASKSSSICDDMNGQRVTLVAYVRHFGKVKPLVAPVVSATMTSINTKEMVLSYVTTEGVEGSVTISFTPPLSGYEEVKPRLFSMKMEALEVLGMAKQLQVTAFELGPDVLATIFFLGSLVYATYTVTESDPILRIGPWIELPVGGPKNITYIWWFVAASLAVEASYAASLCRRHSIGLILSAQWVFATSLLGLPVLNSLRKVIQKARIDSINKVH